MRIQHGNITNAPETIYKVHISTEKEQSYYHFHINRTQFPISKLQGVSSQRTINYKKEIITSKEMKFKQKSIYNRKRNQFNTKGPFSAQKISVIESNSNRGA